MKIKVWISSPENYSFGATDTIEVPNDISDKELENFAREVAFDHVEWGYERVDSNENS